jgi:predicted nucleic-acid-binding protein
LIALDTNILARFYVDDVADSEAIKQRPIALRLMTSAYQLFVPLSVVLELEWVLRAFYGFDVNDFVKVVRHLLGLPNVSVEDWSRIVDALEWHANGLDFADAMHLAASARCTEFASFDERGFARRAQRLGLTPPVKVLTK